MTDNLATIADATIDRAIGSLAIDAARTVPSRSLDLLPLALTAAEPPEVRPS